MWVGLLAFLCVSSPFFLAVCEEKKNRQTGRKGEVCRCVFLDNGEKSFAPDAPPPALLFSP